MQIIVNKILYTKLYSIKSMHHLSKGNDKLYKLSFECNNY